MFSFFSKRCKSVLILQISKKLMLKNDALVAKIGAYTAENEPSKVAGFHHGPSEETQRQRRLCSPRVQFLEGVRQREDPEGEAEDPLDRTAGAQSQQFAGGRSPITIFVKSNSSLKER